MPYPGFDTPAYGQVSGGLPWNAGSSGAGAVGASDPGAIASAYQGAYNSALAMNQSNYQNILSGYQQAVAKHSTAESAIRAGYSDLYNSVLGQVGNQFAGQRESIDRGSAQSLAKSSQQLIDRGLGNTTVQTSVNRGVEADRQYQQTMLTGQQADVTGRYMSQLGQAGLQSQQRGLDDNTHLLEGQLGFMNSVTAKYPDANLYGNLANQAAITHALRGMGGYGGGVFGGGGGPGPKVGYVPGPTPMGTLGGGYGDAGAGGGGWMLNQYGVTGSAGAPSYASAAGEDDGQPRGWDKPPAEGGGDARGSPYGGGGQSVGYGDGGSTLDYGPYSDG